MIAPAAPPMTRRQGRRNHPAPARRQGLVVLSTESQSSSLTAALQTRRRVASHKPHTVRAHPFPLVGFIDSDACCANATLRRRLVRACAPVGGSCPSAPQGVDIMYP